MSNYFEKLFSEFKIKNVLLRNRIVFLPHYTALATMDGTPSEKEIYYYTERAKGGVGLIISGNYAVSKSGQMHRTFINASDQKVIPVFSKITKRVHNYGSKIFGQITHAGPTKMEKPQSDLWSPSQIIEGSSGTHTMKIDEEEINEVKHAFEKSSKNLIESGFDGVEVKIAHDGILRAFLSPHYNKREDKYGGSFENRARLSVEVLKLIRKSIGFEYPIGIRLCMDEFEDDGYKLEDAIRFAKYLEQNQLIDYINVDAGTTWLSYIMQIPPMSIPLGYSEYMSASLKRHISLPVIAFGRINDPVQAEMILQNESADLIGMARQLICDPETPKKAKKGDVDGIRKCIACMDGCVGQCIQFQPIRCIQNPAVGKEKFFGINKLKKTSNRKRIVVVGGGVAGLKFSEIAAKRGHEIVLYEKNNFLGGQLNLLKKIPFRNEFSEILRYLEFQLVKYKNIEINLGFEVKKENILAVNPDVIIIATGSQRYIPQEFQALNTYSSIEVLSGEWNEGKNIIIYDKLAKNEGLGVAEYITEYYDNAKITFITPANNAGEDINFLNLDILYRKLFESNFKCIPYHEILKVKDEKLIFVNKYSRREFIINKYDSFIYIGDIISVDNLFWELKGNAKELYRIGDAKAPRLVELAINDADNLARSI